MKYPIIFWVFSPIGYETYLSFKQHAKTSGTELLLIMSRFVHDDSAILSTRGKCLYYDQDSASISTTWDNLRKTMKNVIEKYGGYSLLVPQTGLPYIQALIESDFCVGFGYYDEGAMSFGSQFFKMQLPKFYNYEIKIEPNFQIFCDEIRISPSKIVESHRLGTPLLNFKQDKYIGSFSFFEEAFPSIQKTLMEVSPISVTTEKLAREFNIILLPRLNQSNESQSLDNFISSVKNIISISKNRNFILKPHPNDNPEYFKKLSYNLEIQDFQEFEKAAPDFSNRETAFLNFKNFISIRNSTIMWRQLLGFQNNIILG